MKRSQTKKLLRFLTGVLALVTLALWLKHTVERDTVEEDSKANLASR